MSIGSSCDCGSQTQDPDGAVDSSEAEPDAESGLDAGLDAASDDCEGFVDDGLRACVPGGRFWFGTIVDEETCPGCPADWLESSRQSFEDQGLLARELSIPRFAIDLREVSIREYADFVAATGSVAPPEFCDYPPNHPCLESPTGWNSDGTPGAEQLDDPVRCVTKDEARAYCEWRGGRLPFTTEWMKAARGALPNRREYPWEEGWAAVWAYGEVGADAQTRLAERLGGTAEASPNPECRYCCELWHEGSPEPVDSRPENASPYGLLHMIGNVYEWVETAATGDGYEEGRVEVVGHPGFGSEDTYEADRWYVGRISGGIASETSSRSPVPRERQLGFRCAYDLP